MRFPFFSIIIPTLNEEKNIGNLLNDLICQTFADFEVFVVDAASEDQTPNIVKKLSEERVGITLIKSAKRGVSRQRNLGASRASGQYVLFFDADNRVPPTYLTELATTCQETMVDAFTTYAAPDTTNAKDIVFLSFTNAIFEAAAHLSLPFAFGACIGCKREVFQTVKGFDEDITYLEDTELVRRIVNHGFTFKVFREPVYTYSLRRFRKEGTVRLYRKLAPVGLKMLVNGKITGPVPEYPMLGGTYFTDETRKKKRKKSIKTIEQWVAFIKDLTKS